MTQVISISAKQRKEWDKALKTNSMMDIHKGSKVAYLTVRMAMKLGKATPNTIDKINLYLTQISAPKS